MHDYFAVALSFLFIVHAAVGNGDGANGQSQASVNLVNALEEFVSG